MAHAPTSTASEKYYVPHGTKWPIVGSFALFFYGVRRSRRG